MPVQNGSTHQRVRRVLASARDWRGTLLQMRWQATRALTPRRLVHARGLQFTLQCENWITHYRWQTYNEKEPETLDWIDRWVREGGTFFDIGANVGVYTLYAALRHPQARVVAFEPEYANLHLLRDNLIANRLQDRVEVYAVALSDRSGVSRLHIQDLAPGAALHTESRVLLEQTRSGRAVLWREGICTLTLDAFCEETGIVPQAIKLDVDGTEPQVLVGARRTLASPTLCSLLIELPSPPESRRTCEQLLRDAGLQCQWRDPQGMSPNQVWARGG